MVEGELRLVVGQVLVGRGFVVEQVVGWEMKSPD